MCHRHRKHPLCLCCSQGHHPPVEPEGVQSGLIVPPRNLPFPSLVGYRRYTRGTVFLWKTICIILIYCRPGLCVSVSTEFVVNIMILFKLFRGKTEDAEVQSQHISSRFFRQNCVTQCILNFQSCTHKDKSCFFLFFSFSFLLSKTNLISLFFLAHTSLLVPHPENNGLYPTSILGQVLLNDAVRTVSFHLSHPMLV